MRSLQSKKTVYFLWK